MKQDWTGADVYWVWVIGNVEVLLSYSTSVYALFSIPYWAYEFLEISDLCISYHILVLFNLINS